MKRIAILILALVFITGLLAAPVMAGGPDSCTTIQDGELTYSAGHYLEGQPLQVGYDIFGYNYQAHMFNGSYANVYLGRDGLPPYEGDDAAYFNLLVDEGIVASTEDAEALLNTKWYWPYRDINLVMKWNDAWLSNKDCDGDGALDRPTPYVGSGAWETNHMWGSYEMGSKIIKWNYFCKIVAVPDDAELVDGVWYTADGVEIGPEIWGAFAIIQEVENDAGINSHGILYNSPAPTGFGYYMP